MPGKIKVKVLAGRNLPVMDRAGDTTDAFVEIKFGSVTHKTDVCRKSLNPHWSSTEWYRFEVDESELQDEPLQLRLMDHDTYSANDAIGKVVISLAPLLAREANNAKGGVPPGAAVMSGWIPVFDTMHGIRGELNVIVKVELFSDFNKYKTSSCGVQFFHCPMIPSNYNVTAVHGFVEELVVNDDPEYQWIDKIRTPRASNEARQVAFIKLSNQVQRLVGLKAAELGANAVVGYQQDFDLEGEAGVVARAIGTAVSITPLPMPHQPLNIPPCTQQQLRKYLDILATDTESITDLNQYFSHHQDELHKLLNILHPKTPTVLDDGETDNVDDDEKSVFMARQLSSKNATSELSLYQDDYVSQKSLKHISDDQIDLNKLLKGSEDSDSDSTGPLQKIKKLKTIFFTKKFGSIRSRKSDKQDDQVSIQSTSSETSRISITDIKNEFQKFKRMKKPKFRKVFANKQDEGVGMASILARSVIHAHTSLACIAENQDSEHSPSSTMRRTSESEPTINMSDDDKNIDNNAGTKTKQLEMRRISTDVHSSLHNINIRIYGDDEQIPHRKLSESCPVTPMAMRSENFLKLPNEAGYYGSLSLSGDSSEVYTSSEEDDESSDPKTDNEKIVETTSSVVQSVLRHNVNPDFIAQMERKLSIFDEVSPRETKDKEKYSHSSKPTSFKTTICDNECPEKTVVSKALSMPLTSSTKTNEMVSQVHINHHHFKLHNPFSHKKVSKTVSAPSSPTEHHGFVYRSSKRIRRQLSKISKSKMLKSISHYSLIPKKNHTETKTSLSQPGSFSDSSKAPSETVLGSPFISYADLLSLDNESVTHQKPQQKIEEFHSRVKMYIGSEPESRASMSVPSSPYSRDEPHLFEHKMPKKDKPALKPTGLVHTAMETILMDKVQSLLVPTSPQPIQSMEKRFFDDVTEKLEQVEGARLIEEALNRGEERTLTLIDERNIKNNRLSDAAVQLLFDQNKNQPRLSSEGLFSDNSSLSTSHNSELERKSNAPKMGRNQSDMSIDKNKKQDNLVQTAMKIILLDKVQSLVSTDSEPICPETPTFVHDADQTTNPLSASEIKNHGGMLHNAMETILMDKAQTLISSTITESIEAPDSHIYDIIKTDSSDQVTNQSSLFHSAMETMLIDKLQSVLISSSPEPKVSEKELESKTDENTSSQREKGKMLLRQDSTYEISEPSEESRKMSKEIDSNIVIPCILSQNKPFLKHFHPILSGAPLETIPSLPETSFDRSESLDVEGVERTCDCPSECDSETNSASVCDNSHAACRFDRSDRDTDPYEDKGSPRHARHESYGSREPMTTSPPPNPSLNASSTPVGIHRRSSDSDLSVTPKGGSLNTSGNAGSGGGAILRPSMNSNNLDMLEYPFLTMSEYPPGFIVHLGGTVCARSVKLVDPDGESAARAAWWAELRTELRAHARALRCNAVIAYTENAAICEDVCVLSASGTAAVINLDCEFSADSENQNSGSSGSKSAIDELESESCTIAHVPYSPGTGPNRAELSTCGGCRRCRVPSVLLATCTKPNRLISYSKAVTLTAVGSSGSKSAIDELESESCTIAHVPYSPGTGPNRAELSTCGGCRRCRVPSVLLATCTKPNRLISYSKAVTLTAVAARVRRVPPASEPGARDISDQLPFLEYELHKLLVAKLRMQGANALFSLQTQITIGDRCVMALASGTAFRLAALPSPTPPRIKAIENDKDAIDIQKKLWESFTANKAANGYDIGVIEHPINCALPETEPESEAPALDLGADKDTCVLELDETEDVETAKVLAVRRLHMQMQVYNNSLKPTHGAPPHAFTQVWRARLVLTGQGLGASVAAEKHVARALDGITFKLRRLQPCALVAPRIQIELPEDEIQIIVSGTAIPLQDPNKSEQNSSADTSQYSNGRCGSAGNNSQGSGSGDADDDIFALDEDQLAKPSQSDAGEDKDKHTLMNGQPPTATTVSLTTLSGAAGARGVRRVCALRLLFVRETTAVRELGGLSGFLHTFTCEVLAIVRAYTAALGGNALTSFYITQLMLQDNAHKNQGQCLLSVGGDVVCITY